ncbi:glycerophosphodiester phosphodiesterase GDPD3 isoform X2 [Daucus carota subsp. sativus]|uniref:glycerophosphodiester phosphodiesterase GDPD3 isoform X2 n=1 Tax=Daucus carota subsp. sativus TaxID=79200 RepID=UPI0007EF5329|nr:PREDICTED: glycerophosphodiester phosphodiesterase GDPD3-like isoform X2 [Daucus carota subsp. sativus]
MAEPRNVNIADIDPYNLDEDVVDKFAAAAAACYSISSGSETDKEQEGGNKKGRIKAASKMMVIGHRGSGMNLLQSSNKRMKFIKENSLVALNAAGNFNLHFIEFDVQVTIDDCPVIFHDDFIFTKNMQGEITEKRATDLTLAEFLSYGPQREPANVGKPLLRKIKDGRIFEWKVETDDHLCTLQQVFQDVTHSLGFNIELKFDNKIVYKEHELVRVIQLVLEVVFRSAEERPIIFSSFQPDAALLLRKLQTSYPVLFITNGGSEIYADTRRNSLDEAIKLCREHNLDGIVSEVRAVLRNPGVVTEIKDNSKLSLITYGQLNNVSKVVYVQHLMGVDGVIVDLIEDITTAVAEFSNSVEESRGNLKEDNEAWSS